MFERSELFSTASPRGSDAADHRGADAARLRQRRVGLSGQHIFFSFQGARLRAAAFRDSQRHARAGSGHRQRGNVPPPGEGQSRRQDVRPGSFAQHGRAHRSGARARSFPAAERIAAPWTCATCRSATRASTRWCAATCWSCWRRTISALTLREIRRVLRAGGTFSLVVIGQNGQVFNRCLRRRRQAGAGVLGPAGGTRGAGDDSRGRDAHYSRDQFVRQGFYPSRVLVAKR